MLRCGGLGGEGLGGDLSRFPIVRWEFFEPLGWIRADALEHVAEGGERADLNQRDHSTLRAQAP